MNAVGKPVGAVPERAPENAGGAFPAGVVADIPPARPSEAFNAASPNASGGGAVSGSRADTRPSADARTAVCATCGGRGSILRPQRKVDHLAHYGVLGIERVRLPGGRTEEVEVLRRVPAMVTTTVGGMDACPDCAARAEAEWRMWRSGGGA